jgi:hypothetical protein
MRRMRNLLHDGQLAGQRQYRMKTCIVCQCGMRCKCCKGGAVPGVSQSAEVRGRVRAETSGDFAAAQAGAETSHHCRVLEGTDVQ